MRTAAGEPVHLVVPADVGDAALVSGGNVYDRRVRDGLRAMGRPVREIPVAGTWPRAAPAARAALDRALAAVPDGAVVLADGLVACGVPDVVGPHAARLALVVLVHLPLGDEAGRPPAEAAALHRRERAVLHAAAAVVATSPWTARRLVTAHGLAPERVHVAAPGADPAPLAPGTGGAGGLLCVGAVTPTKGQDVLVAALGAVADLPWVATLVGPLRRDRAHVAAVRAARARHGLAARVRLAGPRTGAALDAAYAAADLLVVPSRAETYGMVVTEALARGIPVLATTAGGLPRTVGAAPDGRVPGLLVPPGDVPALAAALRRWLTDEALRTRARAAARARRRILDGWEVTTRCLSGVLEHLPSGTPA